jgi:hypothetical protein
MVSRGWDGQGSGRCQERSDPFPEFVRSGYFSIAFSSPGSLTGAWHAVPVQK